MIENGLTATAVSVRGILNGPKEFRVGGVPLISLLRSEPKGGYSKTSLVIPSEGVDLEASPYQSYKAQEKQWVIKDHYRNPGPIQYYDSGNTDVNETLTSLYKEKSELMEELKNLALVI